MKEKKITKHGLSLLIMLKYFTFYFINIKESSRLIMLFRIR